MHHETALLGLMTSAFFTGITGIFPGGIIVPAYLVLFLNQPLRIAGTLAIALLTLGTFRIASRYTLLFGRRRFVFMLITAALWTYIWSALLPLFGSLPLQFRVIGWVIPGLIANHFQRQGILITTASLLAVTTFSFFAGILLETLFGL